MKPKNIILILSLVVLLCPFPGFAQGEAGVPFLLIPSSPESNGMGGIAGSTISEHPMAILGNPGMLGMNSLDHYFIGGIYPSSTKWLPKLAGSDLSYSVTAVNVGVNLNRFTSLPFGVSVGVAYSHIGFDLGTFAITGNDPTILGYFNAEEHSNNLSFGIGFEYFVKLGIGYTTKSVESNLAPFNVQGQGRQGVAKVSTYDIGLIALIPVTNIVTKISGSPLILLNTVEPKFDISFGYARKNLGNDRIVYIDAAQADPLPRTGMLGLSYTAGFTYNGRSASWEVLSFTLARQAEDLLVQRFPAPTDSNGLQTGDPPPPKYVDGTGAIRFWNNVVLGKGNDHATLRKGWQINFGEMFLLRGGSMSGRGESFSTSGFGVRLTGILKAFDNLVPTFSESPVGGFLVKHIDVRYDHASSDYGDPTNLNDGITYDGLSLIVK